MPRRLTGVLVEIADIAGQAAAVQLAASAGGTRVYIPAKADGAHWLVELVGAEAAGKICAHFAADGRGQKVDIPIGPAASYNQLRRVTAQRIHELDDGRNSARTIARQVGVTQRTIYKHRAAHRGGSDNEQGSLF
jgi:hypothetical protein